MNIKKLTAVLTATALIIMSISGFVSYPTENDGLTGKTDTIQEVDQNFTAYDLRTSRTYGTNGYTNIDFEGLAGVKVSTSGSKVTYTAYTHSTQVSITGTILDKVERVERNIGTPEQYTKVISLTTATDKPVTIDLKNKKGVYSITCTTNIRDTPIIHAYLYTDGTTAYTCRISFDSAKSKKSREDEWNSKLKDIDPKDYVSNAGITYPTSGTNGRAVHVKEWEDKSDEIIKFDSWSDEMKVYAFIDYLAHNYAYDKYRVVDLREKSRAAVADDYTNDNMFMYYNHVGVCWDYTNALTIMCRHHGIPATSVEDNHHTWNIIYLNGKWESFDVCDLNIYTCTTKDTDKSLWSKSNAYFYWSGEYGVITSLAFSSVNQQIWTEKTALGK